MIKDVFMQGGDPPANKKRKIIFKDFKGLTPQQKMTIVGQLIGRSKQIHEDDIYQCMLDINELGKKITIARIAGLLNCSARTIYRTIGDELKQEKELLRLEYLSQDDLLSLTDNAFKLLQNQDVVSVLIENPGVIAKEELFNEHQASLDDLQQSFALKEDL